MKHLASKMSSFWINSKSENTSKSYFLTFKRLKTRFVCIIRTVYSWSVIYSHLLDSGASCNTVNSALYSIKWAHRLNNLTDPTHNSFVTSVQEAGRRIACPKKSKKDPVTTEMLIEYESNPLAEDLKS